MELGGQQEECTLKVMPMPDSDYDAILGKAWLDRHATQICWANNTISWKPAGGTAWSDKVHAEMGPHVAEKPARAFLSAASPIIVGAVGLAQTLSTGDYQEIFAAYVTDLESSTTASAAVTSAEQPSTSNPAMDALPVEYEDVFAPLPRGVPDREIQHRISLVPGGKPASKPTRCHQQSFKKHSSSLQTTSTRASSSPPTTLLGVPSSSCARSQASFACALIIAPSTTRPSRTPIPSTH